MCSTSQNQTVQTCRWKRWFCSSLVEFVASRKYKEEMSSCEVKKKKKRFFLGHAELFSDLTPYGSVEIAGNTASTFFPDFLDALTLCTSPTLQAGLRENELRRWLGQDVVAKYLLGRRRCRWGSAYRVQKHWSAFLVLRPGWCRVVNILEACRDLNRKTTGMSFLYTCQTQSVFQAVSFR